MSFGLYTTLEEAGSGEGRKVKILKFRRNATKITPARLPSLVPLLKKLEKE